MTNKLWTKEEKEAFYTYEAELNNQEAERHAKQRKLFIKKYKEEGFDRLKKEILYGTGASWRNPMGAKSLLQDEDWNLLLEIEKIQTLKDILKQLNQRN